MLQLIIDGKNAALPENLSAEYVLTNRLFTDADDFSMTIELPLQGGANFDIFGAIDRDEVNHGHVFFDAELIDVYIHRLGAVVVNSITEKSVKLQFVAGRSYQNFYPGFDEITINSLDLGEWPSTLPDNITVRDALSGDIIALPWINATDNVLQNGITGTEWDTDVTALSWQIRLYTLTQKICTAVNYSFEASPWLHYTELYDLFCFNSVPAAWGEHRWAAMLPAWTLNEFFSYLEQTLNAEIDIDHRNKVVNFTFHRLIQQNVATTALEHIVDQHTITVSQKDDSGYLFLKNKGYEAGSHTLWKYMNCDWWLKEHPNATIMTYPTLQAICAAANTLTHSDSEQTAVRAYDYLLYATDVRTYFCISVLAQVPLHGAGATPHYASLYELRPVNRFGDFIHDSSKDSVERTRIVPVVLGYAFKGSTVEDFALRGRAAIIDCGDETTPTEPDTPDDSEVSQRFLKTASSIEKGKEDIPEIFDNIMVGFWRGSFSPGWLPYPNRDVLETFTAFSRSQDGNYVITSWSYSPFNENESLRLSYGSFDPIVAKTKYEIKFLSDKIPDVRSRFLIHGKHYLCAEIRCTLTTQGVSRLMTGTFYRIGYS